MEIACVNARLLNQQTWVEILQARGLEDEELGLTRGINEFDNRANVFYQNRWLAPIVELIESRIDPDCPTSVLTAHIALDKLLEASGI